MLREIARSPSPTVVLKPDPKPGIIDGRRRNDDRSVKTARPADRQAGRPLRRLTGRPPRGGFGGHRYGRGPLRLALQVPEDAGNDQPGAQENEKVERLPVEPPADDGDERD